MPDPSLIDSQIRAAAFAWLGRMVEVHGEELPWSALSAGFEFEGQRVPLLGPQGIFKPRVLPEMPLSITTIPSGPYDDDLGEDGFLSYRYRGTDPRHRDNAGLRLAMRRGAPLVYLYRIRTGVYLAEWPVYIVGDDPQGLTFTVAVDEAASVGRSLAPVIGASGMAGALGTSVAADPTADRSRRLYITRSVRQRLHQRGFRERVMQAYRRQCAMCRLKHAELLDAAHIIGDRDEGGDPVVPNGLSLCKIHHAAFDRHFLGVSPDYQILVREDIRRETDGPMLRHGLQELHGATLVLPRKTELRPDPERLAARFERFRKAG